VKVAGIGNDQKKEWSGKGAITLQDPGKEKAKLSLFAQISYWGNWVVSVLGFLYWTY
jgi:hypothetical protein